MAANEYYEASNEAPIIPVKRPVNIPVIVAAGSGLASTVLGFALTRDAVVGINSSSANEDQKKLKRKMDAFAIVYAIMAAIFVFVIIRFGRK